MLKLWQEVKTWLFTFNKNLPLDRKCLLFGIHDQSSNSVPNYIILCVKYFIWRAKFQNKDLSLPTFQKFLKYKLDDLNNAYIYEEREDKFEPWLVIYDFLSSLECTSTSEATSPTRTADQ